MENEKKMQKRNFEQIVKEYTPRIFKMIYNMVGDYEATKDLTQDVFVKAWNGFDSFRRDASVYTWIYRIALNRVFEYKKGRARIKTISIDDITVTERKGDPERYLLLKVDSELVKRCIQELPEKYQTILILRYFEDNDYATIAKMMEIPIGTVRSRLHRGISTLGNLIREKI